MDKQMIEEMAKSLCECCIENEEMTCSITPHPCVFAKSFAETIYKQGYRKIPEGAVVLTGTETEQRFEDLMVAFDEMGFMPNTTHPFPEEYVETWKQRLIFVFGQLRKETAEKFAERLKDEVLNFCGTEEENGYFERGKRCFCDDIDEICKEFTGGK